MLQVSESSTAISRPSAGYMRGTAVEEVIKK